MVLPSNAEVREKIAIGHTLAQFREATLEIRDKYLKYHEGEAVYQDERYRKDNDLEETENDHQLDYNLTIPPWICHSYVRAPPEVHKKKLERFQALAADPNTVKRQFFDDDGNEISRKRMKKLRRVSRRPESKAEGRHTRCSDLCSKCQQPKGIKCELCKPCCKDRCAEENLDCEGHRFLIKTNRERLALGLAQLGAKKRATVE